VFSFPVPATFFHRENGQWVDFITPAPLLVAVLNAMSVGLFSVLPLFLAWIVREGGTRKAVGHRGSGLSQG
jgi:hypothetical protein